MVIQTLTGYTNPMKKILYPSTVVFGSNKKIDEKLDKNQEKQKPSTVSKPKAKSVTKKSSGVKAFDETSVFKKSKKKDEEKKKPVVGSIDVKEVLQTQISKSNKAKEWNHIMGDLFK